MSDGISMIDYIEELAERPRGRAGIVLTSDYRDQKKWAEKLAVLTGMNHIDLLDLFTGTAGRKPPDDSLGGFFVPRLFQFLTAFTEKKVCILSGLEFLFASWSGRRDAMEKFAAQVETWEKEPALLFVLQYDAYLAQRPFRRYRQYRFVIDQKETFAL